MVLLESFLGLFGKECLLVFLFVHKTLLIQNLHHHISHTSCPPPSQPLKSVFIALMCTQPPTRKPYWTGVGLLSDSSALVSKPYCHRQTFFFPSPPSPQLATVQSSTHTAMAKSWSSSANWHNDLNSLREQPGVLNPGVRSSQRLLTESRERQEQDWETMDSSGIKDFTTRIGVTTPVSRFLIHWCYCSLQALKLFGTSSHQAKQCGGSGSPWVWRWLPWIRRAGETSSFAGFCERAMKGIPVP